MAALSSGEMPNNRYIPRCPNEETHLLTAGTDVMSERTQGSETSQYLEEKKAIYGTFFLVGKSYKFIYAVYHYDQEEGSCDSLSSGERNGMSPNHSCLHGWGCRAEASFS